jgi:outer membrane protein assembly factor BamA
VEAEGSVDEDLLEDSTNRIEEFLRGQGYRDARAPHTRKQDNDELVITFTVQRGPQYRVERVSVDGNTSVPLAELGATLRTREGAPFSQGSLDADQTTIERLYRGRGFEPCVQADSTQSSAQPGPQVPVLVSIGIIEGVRTIVGSIRIEGNASVSETVLRRGLGLQPGDRTLMRSFVPMQMRFSSRTNLGYRSAPWTAGRLQADRRRPTRVRRREGAHLRRSF